MFFILWVPWALLVPKGAGQGDGAVQVRGSWTNWLIDGLTDWLAEADVLTD